MHKNWSNLRAVLFSANWKEGMDRVVFDAWQFWTWYSIPLDHSIFFSMFAYLSVFMCWEIAEEVDCNQSHQNANIYAFEFLSLMVEIHLCCWKTLEGNGVSCGHRYLVPAE